MPVSNSTLTPLARQQDLVIERMADETLVYDLNTKKAHCLNQFATLVWQHCDGKRSVAEVSELIAAELQIPVRNEGVLLALEQLGEATLLRSPVDAVEFDRRKMLKIAGIAVAAGAVATIVAPTPARAGSMLGSGSAATDGSQCATGIVADGKCIGG